MGHFTIWSSNLITNPNRRNEIAKKLKVEYNKSRVFKLWEMGEIEKAIFKSSRVLSELKFLFKKKIDKNSKNLSFSCLVYWLNYPPKIIIIFLMNNWTILITNQQYKLQNLQNRNTSKQALKLLKQTQQNKLENHTTNKTIWPEIIYTSQKIFTFHSLSAYISRDGASHWYGEGPNFFFLIIILK